MNRRSLIQGLALTPLALVPNVANADSRQGTSEVNDPTFDKRIEDARFEWNGLKMFTLTMSIEPGELGGPEERGIPLEKGVWMPPPFFKIHKIVRASTRSPDIFIPTHIYLIDRNGDARSWHQDLDNKPSPYMYDTAAFFLNTAECMRHLVYTAAGTRAHPDYVPEINDSQWFGPRFEEKLATLGSIRIEFMYRGPTPYPQDGRVYSFDYATDTWQPLNRGQRATNWTYGPSK